MASTTITLKNVTLVNKNTDIINKHFEVKTRYQMTPFKCKVIQSKDNSIVLKSTTPHQFISPGQSCVLYKGDAIIGGGVINV